MKSDCRTASASVSAPEAYPVSDTPTNNEPVCASLFNTFQPPWLRIGSSLRLHRGRGRAVLAAAGKRQNLLAVRVVIGVLEQRFARAWPRQVDAHDAADARVGAVRHHHDAVREQDR